MELLRNISKIAGFLSMESADVYRRPCSSRCQRGRAPSDGPYMNVRGEYRLRI